MVTKAGTQSNVDDLVQSLLNLEHDAVEAYDAVVERLDDATLAKTISEFRADHHRHIRELSGFAEMYDVQADGTAKSMLTKGKIVLADMAGDEAILKAMKTNEDDTVQAYQNAANQDCCTADLREVCMRAHQDELRHRAWMNDMADRLDRAA